MRFSLIENFFDKQDYDYIINIIDLCTNSNDHPGWKLNGFSNFNARSNGKLFWHLDLNSYDYFTHHIFKIVKDKIKIFFDENVSLERVYLNGATFGQQGNLHQDFENDNGRTLLLYCNTEWNVEWAGATVFEMEDETKAIHPRPGRAVYFSGNIPHFSQPLSKDFNGLRVTLAYKLYTEPQHQLNLF
jgi:hypothetical protein